MIFELYYTKNEISISTLAGCASKIDKMLRASGRRKSGSNQKDPRNLAFELRPWRKVPFFIGERGGLPWMVENNKQVHGGAPFSAY